MQAGSASVARVILRKAAYRHMANSIWTTEQFTCPGCGRNYTATKEEHTYKHSGSFKCSVCTAEVHVWSGNHHFFAWEAVRTKQAGFGKRWALWQ